jgi:hypothetical protein
MSSDRNKSNGHGPSFSNGPDGSENELWVGASDPRALAMFGLS